MSAEGKTSNSTYLYYEKFISGKNTIINLID